MPQTTCTQIVKEAGGKVRVRFGKLEYEFGSIEDMRQYVRETLNREHMDAIAMALMLSRQPALGNPSVFEGHAVIVDFSLNNWGRIT